MKLLLAILALACNACAVCPYDPYMDTVREVFRVPVIGPRTMPGACRLVREAHAWPYVLSHPYAPAPPAITAARRSGDCKDKTLWICSRLPGASFVIGRKTAASNINHAWASWSHGGRRWILDATVSASPIPVSAVAPGAYVPLYTYHP